MKPYIAYTCFLFACFSACSGDGHSHGHGQEHGQERCREHSHLTGGEEVEPADEIHFTRKQAEAVGLKVQTVTPGTFTQVIKTGGEVQTPQGEEITLAATASGIVAFANPSITDGTAVKAGEAVAGISSANLPEGDPVVRAKITCEAALKEYLRAEELVKERIVSVKDFEQARLRYETAKTVYEAQSAAHTPTGVQLTAPFSGFVTRRFVRQGEYVSTGQPVAVISQNRRLLLRAEAPGKYYRDLRHVRSANFKTSAGGDTLYKLSDRNGRLVSFGKASGPSSFYIPVTFEFDNTADDLPAGVFAEVYLIGEPQEQVIAIPVSALTEEQGHYFVYLRLDDDGYRKQEVTPGATDGERTLVLRGLEAGDLLVTDGVYQLRAAANAGHIPEGHTHSH
ncbi:MAG: efflux RND transporter periplasmic adaptor subunit [Tannerella sp.]|nr:efflux RND transporter periplasmic adaptor subunit [Tannerella sp.]